ncbi:MAG TPA: hypothetical protein VGN12_18745 [Pirellulales bacterium]|jgi:hypothetical protein
MSEAYDLTPPTSWWGRARFTPVVDALRGQLSARLDPRTLIAAADLPTPLPELIYAVVRGARLSRPEKVALTHELIAQFTAGLAAGGTAEQLTIDFGTAERAAQLIRSNKLRNAPLDWQAAQLPATLAELIGTIVHRARLWRGEKLDVTRELVAHFADGLAAGSTADQLAADFGPVDQAARLIRRGKIRNRPYLWHAARFLVRTVMITTLACIVIYSLLAARLYFSTPRIERNFWIEANTARDVPDVDAGWPLYRHAIVALGSYEDRKATPMKFQWLRAGRQGKHWDQVVAFVASHPAAANLAREGAQKPRLGYLLGDPRDRDYFREAKADWLDSGKAPVANDNANFISVILMGVQELRGIAQLLVADAQVAAAKGDGKRTAKGLHAALALSDQIYQPHSFLVEQMVSFACFGMALEALEVILADTPDVLTDSQLRDLAHHIAAYRAGNITLDFTAERAVIGDILQRAYTDDGHGNGRITAAGLSLAERWKYNYAQPMPGNKDDALLWLAGPGISAVVAGRAETREFMRGFLDRAIAAHQGPPWQWDSTAIEAADHEFRAAIATPLGKVRYLFPNLMMPGIMSTFSDVEHAIQARDAAEVVIALVLFHRKTATWPASLNELVPDLLPAVPADRYDGQPLRYRLRDGRPVVYSIGPDRHDDGGQSTPDPYNAFAGNYDPPSTEPDVPPLATQRWANEYGDAVFWPPVPQKSED